MRINIALQDSYILHTRPYQETSLLLEVFIKAFGRIGMIAKGANRPKSRFRGLLQPFMPLTISGTGRGELLTLQNAENITAAPMLTGRKLLCGLYLNELLMRLIARWDAHEDLFDAYHNSLYELSSGVEEPALRKFEKKLLQTIGYELQLTTDITGAPIEAHQYYIFEPQKGIEVVNKPNNQANSATHPLLFKGENFLNCSQDKFETPGDLQAAKRILRVALTAYLGPKPLETRKLL